MSRRVLPSGFGEFGVETYILIQIQSGLMQGDNDCLSEGSSSWINLTHRYEAPTVCHVPQGTEVCPRCLLPRAPSVGQGWRTASAKCWRQILGCACKPPYSQHGDRQPWLCPGTFISKPCGDSQGLGGCDGPPRTVRVPVLCCHPQGHDGSLV